VKVRPVSKTIATFLRAFPRSSTALLFHCSSRYDFRIKLQSVRVSAGVTLCPLLRVAESESESLPRRHTQTRNRRQRSQARSKLLKSRTTFPIAVLSLTKKRTPPEPLSSNQVFPNLGGLRIEPMIGTAKERPPTAPPNSAARIPWGALLRSGARIPWVRLPIVSPGACHGQRPDLFGSPIYFGPIPLGLANAEVEDVAVLFAPLTKKQRLPSRNATPMLLLAGRIALLFY
jgi:hypothetical protein